MVNKTKVLVATCLCCVGLAGFIVSTNYTDMDSTVEGYYSTTNGSYFQKHLRAGQSSLLSGDEDSKSEIQAQAVTPVSAEIAEWVKYIQNSNISEYRKGICLEALDTISKGCVYHQLRKNIGTATACYIRNSCDKQVVAEPYDYDTQASYKLDDPLYLDCSFFVKHCYYIAGLDMTATTAYMMLSGAEFTEITRNELQPGDIAVKPKHVVIYIGTSKDGQDIYAEMSGHSADAVLGPKTISAEEGYIYKRFGGIQ